MKLFNSIDPVILTLIDGKLHVLLIERPNKENEPFPNYLSLPGGELLEEDYDLEASINRILKAKTGIEVNYVEQLQTFGNKNRDPRSWTVSISYIAIINHEKVTLNETNKAKWVSVSEAKKMHLAFDHNEILNIAIQRVNNKVNYSSLPIHFLPEEFTFPELQKVYEEILGETLDKSSFRSKITDADFIEVIPDKKIKIGAFRPAQLYKIKNQIHNFDSNFKRKNKM